MKTNNILFTAWKNRNQIFEGIKNLAIKNHLSEKVAGDRMVACKACPEIDLEGSKCAVPKTQPCCGLCGCSLSVKLRSLSSMCANEKDPKWLPVITHEQEDELDRKYGEE